MKQQNENEESNAVSVSVQSGRTFLATEPIGKLLAKLALPTIAAQLINMLYNIVDRIYIGHIPDTGGDGTDRRGRLHAADHDYNCLCGISWKWRRTSCDNLYG